MKAIRFEGAKHGAELAARLRNAMIRGGCEPTFWFAPGTIHDSYRDLDGLQVFAETQEISDRCAAYLAANLNAHGFGKYSDGALHVGCINTRAFPFANERNYGRTLVVLGSWPIGD